MDIHEKYIQRCIALAQRGAGTVAPNPMVGAVLVYEDQIIGEGWHAKYGEAHAEVNCLESVDAGNTDKIAKATLYVSLEPCAHFGKTPPCTNLIIQHKIPRVVVGCVDSFKEVAGKGINQLREAGVEVIVGVLEKECIGLNKRFFTYHEKKRPYIILKWAQTADKKIAVDTAKRLFISGEATNRLVHRWRSEEQAILIGANTALFDNPKLNVRLVNGNNPIRLLIDPRLRTPISHDLFVDGLETIVYNFKKEMKSGSIWYVKLNEEEECIHHVLADCYERGIQSILVEGGAYTIRQFIEQGIWDEARIIENTELIVGDGLQAPILINRSVQHQQKLGKDMISFYTPKLMQ
ncbi:MAG: bifunctional diaminohydroxyphosphoribosylaminopyrimidine deaminase/5-amino-6-(5-phosphoribosylamino)uracil reductase RibD [Chitinophagaceae bacterium]|nr:bifunctional diaminohydroxyphosphoribosylaminopyrimidine deaminase/5-amino-6-(5-phosphoribosylamino)uracil reductase RibD [Chitinophagaceae bacterium]